MDLTLAVALLSGIGIAAASGLRAFLPLLALGLVSRFGGLQLHEGARWLGSDWALVAFGVATIVEIAGDKIPVVDHALDTIGTLLRPAAAWLGAYAVLVHWPEPVAHVVAALLGGGTLALHLLKAKLRLGSTATTMGQANPVLSTAEDLSAATLIVIALLVPIAILLAIALVVWVFARLGRRRARRLATGAPTASPTPRS